jgi:hypothetical protein
VPDALPIEIIGYRVLPGHVFGAETSTEGRSYTLAKASEWNLSLKTGVFKIHKSSIGSPAENH